MKSIGPAIKVGITMIVVMMAAYWAFMMVAKGSCVGDSQDETSYFAFFNDATLLVEKSRVQISGLNVGHIVSRELNVRPPREELVRDKRFAKILVCLSKEVTLYSNSVIYKRAASLLGDYYLEIDPGTFEWVDLDGKVHRGEV
ncbi:MAG: MlaD family protein, partial [Pseudomonadota bacterium]